jgi:hypothetical protein
MRAGMPVQTRFIYNTFLIAKITIHFLMRHFPGGAPKRMRAIPPDVTTVREPAFLLAPGARLS